MRAETLLRALPGVGAVTAKRMLATAVIDGGRRVGGQSTGQRGRLVAAYAELATRRDRRHDPGVGS